MRTSIVVCVLVALSGCALAPLGEWQTQARRTEAAAPTIVGPEIPGKQ